MLTAIHIGLILDQRGSNRELEGKEFTFLATKRFFIPQNVRLRCINVSNLRSIEYRVWESLVHTNSICFATDLAVKI